jgi:hypothetical protein
VGGLGVIWGVIWGGGGELLTRDARGVHGGMPDGVAGGDAREIPGGCLKSI